jgi:peptidyl-prolyl cis-trans isomerase C
MFRHRNRIPGFAALALALSISFLQPAVPAFAVADTTNSVASSDTNSGSSDALVAKGKGFEVKTSELTDLFVQYCARAAAQGQPVPEEQRELLRSNLLQHLILGKILVQKATDEDRAKTKELIEKAISESRAKAGSEDAFNLQIQATGMSLDQIRSNAFKEQLPSNVLIRETSGDVKISDADAKKYYDDNPDQFEQPEQVHVSHILLLTQDPVTKAPLPPDKKKEKLDLIKQIRDRALKGEDFGKLAKQYSEDPGSKDIGGEYTFGRGKMVPEFEAAAFSLQTNQISDVVETQYGYHIIKLLEKLPAAKVEFAKIEPRIKEMLTQRAVEKAAPAYLDKIRSDAEVTILDPALAAKTDPTAK